jgi:nucleoside-diphosphate-sugar epimerase
MARVVVTGGSGKARRAVVRDLLDHGDEVLSVDLVRSAELPGEQIQADLTDLAQAAEVLRGAETVVHLAAIPAPGLCCRCPGGSLIAQGDVPRDRLLGITR